MRSLTGSRFPRGYMAVLGSLLLGLTVSGPAQALSPSPADKAEIVFSNGGRILKMNADGSERQVLFGKDRLPDNRGFGAVEPAASPDGEKIVFGFRRQAGYEALIDIWIMNSDGTGARKLLVSTRRERYADPAFTPGGRILAAYFRETGRRGAAQIFTTDLDGSSGKVLYSLRQRFRPWVGWKSLAEPSLSPDGKRLLYLLDPGYEGVFFEDGYGSSLRVLNLTTGKSRELAANSLGGDWSPDGDRIAFSEVDAEGDNDFCWNAEYSCLNFSRIRLVDANGTNAHNLTYRTGGVADERRPDWSAPGRIIFQSTRGPKREIAETTEIWSIRPDGICLTRLTNGSPASLSPVMVDPESKSTGPGTCQGRPPGPNREMKAPALSGSTGHLWLGKSFRNVLLSDYLFERSSSTFFYGDCGVIPTSKCGRELFIANEDICIAKGYAAALIGSGAIQEQRGIPVFRSLKPGRETPAFTIGFSGRKLFYIIGGSGVGDRKLQHRKEIDAIHRVGAGPLDGDLPAPRIPAGDIKVMKRVERIYKRTGSVVRTANILDRGGYFVRSNLRFARIYKAAGGFKAVDCRR